jgi:hypothetical protein
LDTLTNVKAFDVVASDTALWQDHLPPTEEAEGGSASHADIVKTLDLESVQKAYESDMLKIAKDMACFSEYEKKIKMTSRKNAIAKSILEAGLPSLMMCKSPPYFHMQCDSLCLMIPVLPVAQQPRSWTDARVGRPD